VWCSAQWCPELLLLEVGHGLVVLSCGQFWARRYYRDFILYIILLRGGSGIIGDAMLPGMGCLAMSRSSHMYWLCTEGAFCRAPGWLDLVDKCRREARLCRNSG
jgi:hypothetical protein